MKECQPLLRGDAHVLAQEAGAVPPQPQGRGSHSSTSQLNLSRFGHKIHPKQSLIPPNTPKTPPKFPQSNP